MLGNHVSAKCSCWWDKVSLYDLRGSMPAIIHVPLATDGDAPTAVDLGDALPLSALLRPVGEAKATVGAALEALEPDPTGAVCPGIVRGCFNHVNHCMFVGPVLHCFT